MKINHVGAGVYVAQKVEDVVAAYELYEAVRSEDALLNVLTEISELAAGAAVSLLTARGIGALQSEGLERVFDSLGSTQFPDSIAPSHARYVYEQRLIRQVGAYGAGHATDTLIESLRDYVIENRSLDWIFDFLTGRSVNVNVQTHFRASQVNSSPLILDLDGDGIEITQHTGAITFDHDANGIETGTAWAGADDGLLVLDRDGNGSIDSGRELFGNNTLLANGQKAADGYAALRELDANADGVLDASDAAFANLRVWRDLDQDGNSDAGELFSLNEVGVSQIGLSKTAYSQTLADGTRLDGLGSFVIDGQTRRYTDAWFAENPFYREFATAIELSEEVAALPGMKGSGAVRDLQEAAMLSQPLRELLEQFQAASTREAQRALIEPILIAWAATSDFVTVTEWQDAGHSVSFSFSGMDAANTAIWRQRLAVLEAFNAQSYVALSSGTTTVSTGPNRQALLQQSYDALYDSVYGALVMQTRLKPYLDSIELVIDEQGIRLDATSLDVRLDAAHALNEGDTVLDLAQLIKAAQGTLEEAGYDAQGKLRQWMAALPAGSSVPAQVRSLGIGLFFGTAADDVFTGTAGDDAMYGESGNDIINGAAGNDWIDGGEGNDAITDLSGANTFRGGAGNDVINGMGSFEGGAGDDTLSGLQVHSADTYVFNLGDGCDTITEWGVSQLTGHGTGYEDTLRFGEGIDQDQLWFRRVGNDLDVALIGLEEGVVIKDWYASPYRQIEQFKLSDSQALLYNQVDNLVNAMAAFAPPAPGQTTLTPEQQTALAPVIAAAWN